MSVPYYDFSFNMTRLTKTSLLATLILLALFLTVLLRIEPKLQTPLVNMEIESAIPKNATVVSNVPIITGELKSDIKKGAYILSGNTVIPQGTTVNITPDTVFYANRDAKIIVNGKLIAARAIWQSNQLYSQRRYWYGLVAEQNGEITLDNCRVNDATAGLTAAGGGKITIDKSIFSNNVAGLVVLPNGTLKITATTIEKGTVGLQILGGNVVADKTILISLVDGIRVAENAKPQITDTVYKTISGENIKTIGK